MKTRINLSLTLLLLWGIVVEASCYDPYCYSCEQFCPDECHFFIGAEGLYWTVCDNDLDFAVDFDHSKTKILDGHTHFADYDWRWGARVWIGWNWCCGWDSTICYTWYRGKRDKTIDRRDQDTCLKASLLHPSTELSYAKKASSDLELKYQTLDLLFGRTVTYCENSLVLRPYFGARGLYLNQEQEVIYEGGDFDASPPGYIGDQYATPARVTWESKLKVGGLTAGVDMDYRWCSGFGIYGSLGASILAGHTDNDHLQVLLDSTDAIISKHIDLDHDHCIAIPGIHLQGGVNYHWSCGECLLMKFHILYEFNQYCNTPHLRRYSYGNEGVSSSGSAGNIALHGITVGGEIFF